MAKDRLSGKLAVILHADIVGSTALVHQDEQLAHQRIQDTFRRFGDTVSKYYGQVRELKPQGTYMDAPPKSIKDSCCLKIN
jgi:class 3 adenylate cyclase